MAFFVGQCCVDQIIAPPESSSNTSGLNEELLFINQATADIQWNATRKARFGTSATFYVEVKGPDGKYRPAGVEAIPDVVPNTTKYTFDFGGLADSRVTIS